LFHKIPVIICQQIRNLALSEDAFIENSALQPTFKMLNSRPHRGSSYIGETDTTTNSVVLTSNCSVQVLLSAYLSVNHDSTDAIEKRRAWFKIVTQLADMGQQRPLSYGLQCTGIL
jgi:hypothetical protein